MIMWWYLEWLSDHDQEATYFVASRDYDIVRFPNFKKKVGTHTKWIEVPHSDEFYQLKDDIFIVKRSILTLYSLNFR